MVVVEMSERPIQYTLNLNGPKGRIALRILAIAAPLYLIAVPFWLFGDSFSAALKFSIIFNIILCLPSLLATVALVHLLRKIVTVTLYPQSKTSLTQQKYIGNIDKISLLAEHNSLIIESGRKKLTAPLEALDQTNVDMLLNILKKLPNLENINGLTQELVKLKRKPFCEGSIRLKYSTHMMMRRTIEAIKDGERTFWTMWAIGWSSLGFCALCCQLEHLHPFFMVFTMLSYLPLYVVGLFVAFAVMPTGIFVTYIANDIYGQIFILLVSVITIICLWSMLLRPNRILLDKDGITKIIDCGIREFVIEKILWSEVAEVSLITETNELSFRHVTEGKPPLLLMLSGLRNPESKTDLFKFIQMNIPAVSRDPAIEASLSNTQEATFTQLWLSSLAIPPKREMLTPLERGHTLEEGRYVIENTLAAGGQGVAYIAQSADLSCTNSDKENKSVILKESVLPLFVDDHSRKKAIDKFEQEALLLKKLDSPHIVKLLDYFIEDHRTYFVLEHIDGLDLRKIVEADGAMTSSRVLTIAKEMSNILEYLHSLSPPVVHRDFTADNLVLGSDNKLKLIDFEVAHEGIQKSTATVVGKHCYIPPEQLRGKPEPASDLYAMGCTLFFLYTGKEPEPLSRQSILSQQEIATAEEDTIVLHNIISQLTHLEPNKRLTNKGLRTLLKIENDTDEAHQTIRLEPERELAP